MEKIAIVGMGTMGRAIRESLAGDYQVTGIGRGDAMSGIIGVDAVILAVKPQQFKAEVAEALGLYVGNQLFISIMAGVKTRRLRQLLGTNRVVRAMPNRALATGNSLTAWYTEDESVNVQELESLFGKWGKTMRLDSERQFAPFTALAGCGLAYFFRQARVLVRKALGYGFSVEQAQQIATYTFLGTASMVGANTDFDDEIRRVASKGGATEAAMDSLDRDEFDNALGRAIDAACARTEALGD